jgi:hypothetical protein
MKKIFKLCMLMCCSSLSCTNLDLNPLSEGSSESWYSSDSEIELSVNYLYNWSFWDLNPDRNNFNNTAYRDAWTDDWTNRNIVSAFANGTLNAQTNNIVHLWTTYYKAIAACNNLIQRLEQPKENVSEAKRIQFLAEARFVRAAQYAKLIFHWGDVPYLDKTVSIDEAFKLGRVSKTTILAHVYQDFDYAVEHLPISYSGTQNSKATKGAALALKARTALYMGDYQTAKVAAQACMDLGKYQLFSDFESLFHSKSKNTVESVFAIPQSVELTLYPSTGITQQPLPRNAGGNSFIWPSWDLFNAFLCADGLPIDESPLYNPQKPFDNRDPRCKASIVEFGTNWGGYRYQPHPDSLTTLQISSGRMVQNNDTRGIIEWASWNGLIWKKRIDEDWFGDFLTDPDHMVIRYADVMLIYAEAKIELNEIDASVLSAMNMVRARAYGVGAEETGKYPAITATSQDYLRKTLRIERRMEFAFEGLRYNDIIRWKLAEKVLNTTIYAMLDPKELRERITNKGLWFFPETVPVDGDGISDFKPLFDKGLVKMVALRSFDKTKHYLWPIPATEAIINPNMEQNPGY